MSSQRTTSEPTFPTQSELRKLVHEVETNAVSRQLFFDAMRFRAIVDLDGVVVSLNDYAVKQRGADLTLILDRPMWEDPLFAGDPLWEGRLRSRFAEALASPADMIEYEDRIDFDDEAPLIVRVRVAVIRNAGDVPIGFLVDSQDIGREHRSRALVREQQRLLHVVFERTFQLVAILDATGRIIDVNDAISRIGLTRDIAVGRTIMELGAAEGPARIAEWQARIDTMQTATEPRRYFDVRDPGPGGGRVATDVSMTPVRNEDGTLDLILLEFRDQTERYEAEERLRESEERLRLLVEALPQMVWSATADGKLEYLSPSWQDFTGRSASWLMRGDWRELVHPDDRALVAEPLGDAPVVEREFRMKARDGRWRWMHSRARSVVDAAGQVRRWYGATSDITDRKEADELFRRQSQQIDAAAEISGLGSFVWDMDADELHTDERYGRIMGFRGEDLGEDKWGRFVERMHPEDRDRITEAVRRSLVPGAPRFREEYRMLGSGEDVDERWVACAATVEFDDQGAPHRMFGALEDVTARRREDEARARLQKVEAIGTLVGAVAHDFNNVIGAVLTYARIAEAEMAAGEMPEESIAEIARGSRRAADILGRLMAFGREETPRRIRFDLAEVVDEAAALVRPTLPAGAELEVDCDEDLPPLDGDPTQIHQVMVNLLTNAGHAVADADDARISLRASVVDLDAGSAETASVEPGQYVRVTVLDNGPGFPPGIAHRLFDPFFTTKPAGKGTGLGLSAVQSIVRAHRGAVTALEPPSGGAMFNVLLPVVEDASSPGVTPSVLPDIPRAAGRVASAPEAAPVDDALQQLADGAAPASEPAKETPQGRVRALFVDDEPALVRLAGRAMPYRDIDVSGHVDAAEALEVFRGAPEEFDVLVTDLSMPAMTGFELIDQVREIRPGFPVVLTSGYLGPADEQAADERQVDAVLPKPCSIDALAAAVQRVTGRS